MIDAARKLSNHDLNYGSESRPVPRRRVSGLSFQIGAGLSLARHRLVPIFLILEERSWANESRG
jgi:hypothetical protein